MLPNMNASNISPELLQNLLKLIATAQNQNQNQAQGANQNQNPLTKLALNKPTTPLSSNPFAKTESTPNPQQMNHRSNNATPSNGQRVQNNDSHPLSSKPSPRPSTPKPQNQNMGMRNNSIENRMRPMDKMQTEDNGFIRMQDEAPRPLNFRMNNQQRGPQDAVTVLMVAEKPSIAKAISEALSNGRSRSRKGVSKFCQVHEFHGDFFGQKAFFKVTSVTGHIYVADFPTEYQDWRTVDPHSLFDAPTIKKQANPDSQIIEHLQNEAQDVTYLVLWLDNDREGENICFEVIDNVKAHMRQENFDQILRVKFSSLVRQDIVEAFRNVNSGPNLNESKSVDARQILDLKIGVAFSRFQTRYLLRRYPNLNTKLVTFGPCQTPTLGFCVERDDEIKNFVSKPFYRIVPVILTGAGERCELTWSNERTFSLEEAQQVKTEIELAREVVVLEVSNKESIKGRPEALNTPHMLKLASSLLGMGPQQTMQVAEKLYQQGYMTYPRTESTSYPQKFDFAEVIQHLCDVPQVSNYCSRLLHNINPPKRGKDAGDHPPITPTLKVPLRANLKDEEWKLYEFIVRHFLATISHDARITNMSVNFQAGKHKLHLKGSHLIDRGFMEITPWVKVAGTEIPEFLSHQRLLLNSVEIKTGKTTPPDHITESDLITLMEKNGIGTDASMAQHINNICERNYVKVVGVNRKLVPTDLGSALIHGYQSIDPDLVAPTLRSLIEQRVDMIAKGQIDYQQVVTEVLAEFSEKFLNFKNNITAMDAVFTQSFGTFDDALAQADQFSVCGKCGDPMLYVEKFHRLHCNNCNLNLTLPQNGKVEIAGDRCCPIDGFQLLVFTSFNQITSYLICPCCSNRSPHPEISARLTCNLCPEAECPYSSVNSELQDCNKCHQGKMILDQQVEDRLTASCNYCSYKILIAQNILSFQRGTGNCPKCSSYLFAKISFNNGKPSCENVCVFCHPEFSGSIMPCENFGENPEQHETRNPRERSFSERRPQERTNSYNNRAPRNNMEPSLQKGSYKISKMDRNDRNDRNGGGGGYFRKNNYNNNNNDGGFRNNNFRSGENRNGGDGMGRPQQQRFPRKNFQNNNGFQNRDYGQNQHNNNFQRRNNGPSWKNNQFQQTS